MALQNISTGTLPVVLNNRVVKVFLDGDLLPDFHVTFDINRSTKPDEINHCVLTVWGLSTLAKDDSQETGSGDLARRIVENFDGLLVQVVVGWGDGLTEAPIEFPVFTGICRQIKQGREGESFFLQMVCVEGLGIQRTPFRKSWKSGTPVKRVIDDTLAFIAANVPAIRSVKNNYKLTRTIPVSVHATGPVWAWFTQFLAQNLFYPYIDGITLVIEPIRKNDFFDWLESDYLKSSDPDQLFSELPDYLSEDLAALAVDYGGLQIKNFWQAPINPSNIVSSPELIQKSVLKKETKKKAKRNQQQEIEVRTLIIPVELNNVYTVQSGDFGLDGNGSPQVKRMIIKELNYNGSNWQPEFYVKMKGLVV